MRHDEDFKLFVCVLSPECVDTTMPANTFDKTLTTVYGRVNKNVLRDLRSLHEECLAMGHSGFSFVSS